MNYDYDLFVIGGGSGGVRAARKTSHLGQRVGIAEEHRYGGTCVIRGCVPKKLYLYAARFSESFQDSEGFGWKLSNWSFDWSKLVMNKEHEITRLERLYREGLQSSGVEVFDSRAELKGPHEIWIQSLDQIVTAERIVIAVGGKPNCNKDLVGYEYAITSDEVFDLEKLPKTIIINGAGYIAIELASIFKGLGVDTTILYHGITILRGFDDDLRFTLQKEYEKRGIKVITEQSLTRIESCHSSFQSTGPWRVHLSGGDIIQADVVMMAIGRIPNTDSLGLEGVGVKTDNQGYIQVNEYSRTNIRNIWALGDVTNRVPLTSVAIHEAMCFIATEYMNSPQKPDYDMIARVVFSHPEIGTIGLTEMEAAKNFDSVNVFKTCFRTMKSTLSGRDSKMLMKLIVDGDSDKIVGAHILGPNAGEIVQMLAISMKMGVTKSHLDRTMAVHPTAGEELVTMYEPTYRIKFGKRLHKN
ncbi:glutathione-disulfide reductase [Candidatus Endowatersipora endosymbiont of Watersipora subatra]|uniref:glutathione-disulfide reductase n=1 Tax=Candidatus Endowatersipora endosymbiont of Watersipora subatra TaxID=3077946 RepID=UPI003C7DACAD